MSYNNAFQAICQIQKEWAQANGIAVDSHGYTCDGKDNLYESLDAEVVNELAAGRGDELEKKIRALHSSSALVCNVFHYWRYRSVDSIAKICGCPGGMNSLLFESKHNIQKNRFPAHLDLEFRGPNLRPTGVESKFTEPYNRGLKKLNPFYRDNRLWVGLPRCGSLADTIINGKEKYYRFDAPQLLKHILGMKTKYSKDFELVYLWYKYESEETEEHNIEMCRFQEYLDGEINCRTLTYQKIFEEIRRCPYAEPSYVTYLERRYF